MNAAVIERPGSLHILQRDRPEPGPAEVLIEVASAGICGTDLHILKGSYESTYPIVPGHEFSGTVAAVGADVTAFRPGDRVTADPNVPCNICSPCQRNHQNHCENWTGLGVTRPGAFAEFVLAPQGNVFGIGDLPFDSAALVEPLACVVWGLKRVRPNPGDVVLIFGAGPMGCLLMQAIRHAGASATVVVDPIPERLDHASELGASETIPANEQAEGKIRRLRPDGFDVVVDATGRPDVVERLPLFARPMGKIWMFGVCPPGVKTAVIPYDIFRKDLTLFGSFALCKTFPESLALIQSGTVKVASLVSHRLPLARAAEAMEIAEEAQDRMKVQLEVGS